MLIALSAPVFLVLRQPARIVSELICRFGLVMAMLFWGRRFTAYPWFYVPDKIYLLFVTSVKVSAYTLN